MGNTVRLDEIHPMTVDEFLATPQSAFGSAWRYELVDGLPVAQAAPSDEHAMISANLATALTNRLRGNRDCVPLIGGAVIPKDKERRTARIPDATVRCVGKAVAMFEIVSPTDGITTELSVCPEMIFRPRKPFGNKTINYDCFTGRKTSLFSNFFGNLDYNNSWL